METVKNLPLDYLDTLECKKHILLLYDNVGAARLVMFRFIKNGLTKGEHCLYATDDDPAETVIRMLMFGISLMYFQNKKLKVYNICNTSTKFEEIMENSKRELIKILSNLNSPFRMVSKILPMTNTRQGMSIELELERLAHKTFDNFNGSVMCPYDISKIEKSDKEKWLDDLRENHHEIIYIPKSGRGEVF